MSAAEGGQGAGLGAATARAAGAAARPTLSFRARLAGARSRLAAFLSRQAETETAARTGFFLIPAALMLGIALFFAGPTPAGLALVGLLGGAIHAGARLGARSSGPTLALAGLLLLAGHGLAALEMARTRTTIFSGEATVRIEGTVAWRDRDDKGRTRYLVDVAGTERPHLSRPPERAQILVSSRHAPIDIGGRYRGLVRLRAPSGPAYPGGYDFAFGNFFSRLGATGFALGPPDPASAETAPQSLSPEQRVKRLRLAVSERIRDSIGGAEGAVATALVTGDRAGIPGDVEEWLRSTGLSHVLSISGLHMALVAGFTMALVRGLLAAIPWCALTWPVKKIAAVAALAVSAFYLMLSGSNVASDRSFIMLSIVLLAVLFDRPALTLRNVAIAAIVVLALEPHALMTASFQMSFSATAALVGVYGGFSRWWARRGTAHGQRPLATRTLLFLLGLGAASLIAGAATAPYAAYHFQRVAPYGLVANLIAVPLFSFWIMPVALIAMLAMPFGLDAPFLALMGHGLTLVFAIARFLHERLPDEPTGITTTAGLLLLTLALVAGCFLSSRLRWAAVPLALCGLALAPDRSERPELLAFEDGREVAMIDAAGNLVSRRERPNAFVYDQWLRAFPPPADAATKALAARTASAGAGEHSPGFVCETVTPATDEVAAGNAGAEAGSLEQLGTGTGTGAADRTTVQRAQSSAQTLPARRQRPMSFCRGTTRSGIRIAWTDDYRQTGRACDSADIAIVARAIRLDACRSGARLITLRTLRRSGSLAVAGRTGEGAAVVTSAIGANQPAWGRHRLAPWPEAWRRPEATPTPHNGAPSPSAEAGVADETLPSTDPPPMVRGPDPEQ
jgi:competence protein ComEC